MSRFSLSIRLTLFFSLIVLLVTTTLSTVVFYPFGEKINQQIERNLTGITDHKAAEISNVLLFERTDLLSWRALPDVAVDDLDKRITTELIKNLLLAAALAGIPMLLLVVLLGRLLVTSIKKLQSAQTQLVQSEKMASLGQLVAGIAHEINNPIGAIYANMPPLEEYINAIKGTVEFAQNCMDEPEVQKLTAHMAQIGYDFVIEDLAKLLNSQKQAADRIRNIVLSLRNFSRLDQGEVKTVQLEEGLDSTLQMLHHNYKDRIVIEKDYTLNEPVECYAGELNRVFMNILANAIQAIPEKGSITIATAKVNGQAVVSIADTGIGMPDEVKRKIFDPFFTTKDVGEGTGLGLSISYGIIEKHQGTLTVESELNRGTQFVITIPLRLIKDA